MDFISADNIVVTSSASLIIAALAIMLYMYRRASSEKRLEHLIRSLYELSVEAGNAASVNNVIAAIEYRLEQVLNAQVQVILKQEEMPPPWRAIANVALGSKRAAGAFTDTLSDAPVLCIPLLSNKTAIGVIFINSFARSFKWSINARLRMLAILAAHAALCIEKTQLAQQQKEQQLHIARDQVLAAVLTSLSHDLRTPLAGIISTLTLLNQQQLPLQQQQELIEGAAREARQLDIFLSNLMLVTRIENGMLGEVPEAVLFDDIISSVLQNLCSDLQHHTVTLKIDERMPLLHINSALLYSVLMNICQNACKYAPQGKSLLIEAKVTPQCVQIDIEDDGAGILIQERENIFRKFCRLERGDTARGGAGLGLYICRTLMRAYGGDIIVTDAIHTQGARFVITLPLIHTRDISHMLGDE